MSTEVLHLEDDVCRHCGKPIEPCPVEANPFCHGWVHVGYPGQPIGRHYCGARSVNPRAEPVPGTDEED